MGPKLSKELGRHFRGNGMMERRGEEGQGSAEVTLGHLEGC